MDKLLIEGKQTLNGTISVGGSKNAALPILLASILLDAPINYTNVPNLRDITTTLNLLRMLGCTCEQDGDKVQIAPSISTSEAPYDLVRTMRASVLCLGPLLARTGKAKVALPGGCAIGARPVDQHLKALSLLGANFSLESGYIVGQCQKLRGAQIAFDLPTVGGTENLLMATALAEGESILENCAREPEIVDLANFLCHCGAKISGQGTSTIIVQGVSSLSGTTYQIMPDRIEAGTLIIAAGITKGKLTIKNCPYAEMEATIAKLREMGMQIEATKDNEVMASGECELKATDVQTSPYPGFPTDMQAQIMALMCIAQGSGMIEEKIFENRFMHVPELSRLGADIKIAGRTAMVRGVNKLIAAPLMASDLRASASLVLAGLAATGTTEIRRIYHLDRGYEKIDQRLNAVGAKIRRVKDD